MRQYWSFFHDNLISIIFLALGPLRPPPPSGRTTRQTREGGGHQNSKMHRWSRLPLRSRRDPMGASRSLYNICFPPARPPPPPPTTPSGRPSHLSPHLRVLSFPKGTTPSMILGSQSRATGRHPALKKWKGFNVRPSILTKQTTFCMGRIWNKKVGNSLDKQLFVCQIWMYVICCEFVTLVHTWRICLYEYEDHGVSCWEWRAAIGKEVYAQHMSKRSKNRFKMKLQIIWPCMYRTVCEDWVVSQKNTVQKREAHQKNILEWYLIKNFFWGKIKLIF